MRLLTLLMITLWVPAAAAGGLDVDTLMERSLESYSRVSDYTCRFHKTELIGEELLTERNILFKFMKPMHIHMKMTEGRNRGIRTLYIEGENDNRMRVKPKGLLGFLRVSIDPEGKRAMKDNRHSILEAGIGHVLGLVDANYRRWREGAGGTIIYEGEEVLAGRRVHAVRAVFPKDKGYYGHVIRVSFDAVNFLPVRIVVYDWEDRLLEDYQFEDLELNVGLKRKDFKL